MHRYWFNSIVWGTFSLIAIFVLGYAYGTTLAQNRFLTQQSAHFSSVYPEGCGSDVDCDYLWASMYGPVQPAAERDREILELNRGPVDCLSEELGATYEKLEGVRLGDPDYAEAVLWSSICPLWGVGEDN